MFLVAVAGWGLAITAFGLVIVSFPLALVCLAFAGAADVFSAVLRISASFSSRRRTASAGGSCPSTHSW